jgi:hypothetical protein
LAWAKFSLWLCRSLLIRLPARPGRTSVRSDDWEYVSRASGFGKILQIFSQAPGNSQCCQEAPDSVSDCRWLIPAIYGMGPSVMSGLTRHSRGVSAKCEYIPSLNHRISGFTAWFGVPVDGRVKPGHDGHCQNRRRGRTAPRWGKARHQTSILPNPPVGVGSRGPRDTPLPSFRGGPRATPSLILPHAQEMRRNGARGAADVGLRSSAGSAR